MKKKILAAFMVMILALGMSGCGSGSATSTTESESETEEQITNISWPSHGIGKDVPQPDINPLMGYYNWEEADSFSVNVANITKDVYDKYINACLDAGFDIDYQKSETTYWGDNADGYHLTTSLEDGMLLICVQNYHLDDESTTETIAETEAPATESKTESTTEASESSDEIRPATKEALDAYETFMNDYVDFMKKYNDNPSDSELLKEYADYMTKYADFTDKFNKMEDDLNDAELSYYLKVQARVLDKLSEVQ